MEYLNGKITNGFINKCERLLFVIVADNLSDVFLWLKSKFAIILDIYF